MRSRFRIVVAVLLLIAVVAVAFLLLPDTDSRKTPRGQVIGTPTRLECTNTECQAWEVDVFFGARESLQLTVTKSDLSRQLVKVMDERRPPIMYYNIEKHFFGIGKKTLILTAVESRMPVVTPAIVSPKVAAKPPARGTGRAASKPPKQQKDLCDCAKKSSRRGK